MSDPSLPLTALNLPSPHPATFAPRHLRWARRAWEIGPSALAAVLAAVTIALASPIVAAASKSPRSLRAAPDASVMPRGRAPTVVPHAAPNARKTKRVGASTSGWSHQLLHPRFVDKRRRVPQTERPAAFGFRLRPGERFKFDVSFAGNPAGLAKAEIVAVQDDPRGPAPAGAATLRIEGHARTSGIVSLLASVTDDIVTIVDAHSGAAISSVNVLQYTGWTPGKYKHRVTEQSYQGRGYVRVVDTKDGKAKKKRKRIPIDTFDTMSCMAWVRTLDLKPGERAKAHIIDGSTLMRIEIESLGSKPPAKLPSIARALELQAKDITMIRGVLTRVDKYDQPVPGKRVFKLRAWVSNDDRRIPLVLESDMWVGSLQLSLSSYDPPTAAARPE